MEIQTKQVNITQLFEENVVPHAQVKITDIRNQVIEIWNKEPIITQFPDVIGLIEPTDQITLTVQNKRIIIANQQIIELIARSNDKFIRLVVDCNKIINKPIKAFGFNYSFQLSLDKSEIKKFRSINQSLVNIKKLKINEDKYIGNGLNICYMDGRQRIQLIGMPMYSEDLKQVLSLDFQINVHFFVSILPKFRDLQDKFIKHHSKIVKKLREIYAF